MSRYDELLMTLRAGAYEHGVATLAARLKVSDDTVRRLLSPKHPPLFMQQLRRLERVIEELSAER